MESNRNNQRSLKVSTSSPCCKEKVDYHEQVNFEDCVYIPPGPIKKKKMENQFMTHHHLPA